jgi:hypothetical protein
MIEQVRGTTVPRFRVFDATGRSIGSVVRPTSSSIVGLGARTVLLVRDEEGRLAAAQDSLLSVQ